MCKKCYFPGYKKRKKAAFIVLIKFWLNDLHFQLSRPTKCCLLFLSSQLEFKDSFLDLYAQAFGVIDSSVTRV